jgi:hypothetical protein
MAICRRVAILWSRTLTIASYATSPKSIKDADPSGISTLVTVDYVSMKAVKLFLKI